MKYQYPKVAMIPGRLGIFAARRTLLSFLRKELIFCEG